MGKIKKTPPSGEEKGGLETKNALREQRFRRVDFYLPVAEL